MNCIYCGYPINGHKCSRCGALIDKTSSFKMEEVLDTPTMKESKTKDKTRNIKVEAPKVPTFTKVKNFSKAIIRHTLDGFKNVSDTTHKKRLEICRSCDRYNSENKTCNECGCYVEIKAAWASESCPLGKWKSEEQKSSGGIILPTGGCGGCGGKKP